MTWDCNVLGHLSGTLDGTFTITVGADGVAVMDISHTIRGSCGGPDVGTLTTPVTVRGQRTPTGFEFPDYFGVTDSITMTVSGNQATGSLTATAGGGSNVGVNLVSAEVTFEATRA